jgi:hypothetical protein
MRPSAALHYRKANQAKIELMIQQKTKKGSRKKKKLKTKKKSFDQTVYTFDAHQKAKFKTALARMGITLSNYVMITVNCPEYIDIVDKELQLTFLISFLNSFKFSYVACCEWSDERANGYHLHIIISREDLDLNSHLFSDETCYESDLLVDNSLDRCLGYITKERKGCTTKNRKEKFYFSNISERKLIPIGISHIIKEEPQVKVSEESEAQIVEETRAKPKKKLKVFLKALFKRVKILISRLFIKNQEQYYYDYKKEIVCHSGRDGPT